MAWLFEHTSEQWAHDSARHHAWRGLSLYAVDGTTLRVADSDENREHFGLANGGHRSDSGYPLVRMNTLVAIRSHLLAAADFGPYSKSEKHYAEALWERIAAEAEVPPIRVSFSAAMHSIRVEWEFCAIGTLGTIPKKLRRIREKVLQFELPKRRSERSYPRAVKVKMSNYPKKRRKSKTGRRK